MIVIVPVVSCALIVVGILFLTYRQGSKKGLSTRSRYVAGVAILALALVDVVVAVVYFTAGTS
ncbi:hypothetical protein IFT90_00730 [Frigoribacterium sp. CFBP 8766]|uniref:hypothetical protein n=1 Tax=Frigoribacterium sp. CFBP 8766 TaxID=2775273 RepID=UPI001784B87F|nr:hypothetical protein [Frigoribacterium sp. CFBP 8766]MBD8583074.1 hypothetical protein [Frigoribacterium sp. CFBP 8766]